MIPQFFKISIRSLLLLLIFSCSANCKKQSYTIYDTRFFEGSKTYELVEYLADGDYKSAQELVDKDPSVVDTPDLNSGTTALYWAIYLHNKDAALFLLRNGANPNWHDKINGFSPMLEECGSSNHSLDILKLLIKYGGDVNDISFPTDSISPNLDPNIRVPLAKASANYWDGSSLGKVKLLLDHGAKVDLSYRPGETALLCAVSSQNYDVAKYLIENANADYKKAFFITISGDSISLKSMIIKDYSDLEYRNDKDYMWVYNYIQSKP